MRREEPGSHLSWLPGSSLRKQKMNLYLVEP
jgi:hypothetical protein